MYDQSLEQLIDAVIADGVITDQERKVVLKKAAALGIDQDEIEVYLDGRLDAVNKNNAPKSGKHGVVKTCPNCGAVVEAGTAKCKECGYAFSGLDANSSAKELDRRLRGVKGTDYEDDEKRANIISSFPIPNTREDLMEFLAALEPKAFAKINSDNGAEKKMKKAYKEKFEECVNKAMISFPDDPATKHYLKKIADRKKKRNIIIGAIVAAVVIIVTIICIAVSNANAKEEAEQEALRQEYAEWEAQVMPEIEAYAAEMNAKLDKIPTPTTRNWETCGAMWNKITWDKAWKADKNKYKAIIDDRELEHGADYDAFEAFVKKKNNIGKQIRDAHRQVLSNSGMAGSEVNSRTYSEYQESSYRR